MKNVYFFSKKTFFFESCRYLYIKEIIRLKNCRVMGFISLLNYYVGIAFGVFLLWLVFTPTDVIKIKIKNIAEKVKKLFKK